MSDLYKRIEELCKAKGVTITDMCRASGAPRGSLSDLKMGRTNGLNANTLSKISAYFEVSTDYLLGNVERFPNVGDESLLSAETLASLSGEETKKPADQKASGLRGTGYDLLNDENRAMIDSLIDSLLRSQSAE